MRYRNVVLYRGIEDGPLNFALVVQSHKHIPQLAGKTLLQQDGKTPLAAEEHLTLVYLDPGIEPRTSTTAAETVKTAFDVRPAVARAGAPGWIAVDLVARHPARLSRAEFEATARPGTAPAAPAAT
jgi:hypothetical protein